jgi:hypothetical protein
MVVGHASAGWLRDDIAGMCDGTILLTGTVLGLATVWWIRTVDGLGSPLHGSLLRGFSGR